MTTLIKVLNQDCGNNWNMYNGDSVQMIKNIPNESVHYSIYSPPFINLYTYSNSQFDIGNCKSDKEFYNHFRFLAKEMFRVIKSGRNMSVHCMDVPMLKQKDGEIGLKDFPGALIRMFTRIGFIYHGRVTVFKDPVVEMVRTNSIGLLHKQLKKDSSMSRPGLPDYILTFRKPGENIERITHTNEDYPVNKWQKIASPIWMDINQSETLNGRVAREEPDEKHIVPLQLGVIRKCLELWTNPNDIVLDPFAGIGSTGYEAVKMGRRFLGFELKQSYYNQAVGNLKSAENELAKPKQVSFENFGIVSEETT